MTQDETKIIEARIDTIRDQMAAIPALLDGALLIKHNRVRRKDGSVWVSPQHLTFQYRGADGKRTWKRIPRHAQATVIRLVKAGDRYRELVREYTALLTALALSSGSKKKD
jgi:hypothetical protein